MSGISNIVNVSITRNTQAVARASFGVFGIVSEFETGKTTVPFVRHRHYSSLDEMTTDGWSASDNVYRMAQKALAQNPKPTQIMVGRLDSGDADIAAGLTAIQIATSNWYVYELDSLVPEEQQAAGTWTATQKKLLIVDVVDMARLAFDADFVTGNQIVVTVTDRGVATPTAAVDFATDHATTMAAVIAAIETAGYTAILDPVDTNDRTIIIVTASPVATVAASVTGGASQANGTPTYYYVPTNGTNDVASWADTSNQDRVSAWYHPEAGAYPGAGIAGVMLPKDPGSATWAHKTIAGVTTYELTTTERNEALGKEANIYTEIAGVAVTQFGTVASGEYVDVMRGIDWLESRLQEDIFSALVNNDKIPFTDGGITVIEGIVRGVLTEAARAGILVADDIDVSVPTAASVTTTDKANRNLPDVTFTATLQGAIHKVSVSGTVTV